MGRCHETWLRSYLVEVISPGRWKRRDFDKEVMKMNSIHFAKQWWCSVVLHRWEERGKCCTGSKATKLLHSGVHCGGCSSRSLSHPKHRLLRSERGRSCLSTQEHVKGNSLYGFLEAKLIIIPPVLPTNVKQNRHHLHKGAVTHHKVEEKEPIKCPWENLSILTLYLEQSFILLQL